ncbi:adenosine deaminase [Brevibacterium sp. R8603A2]|uniref:adenosine deaminase n=1 Tax=Brevibacterium sp. R8603A2 TaxID=2929779 RepID=UPI001FFB719A|nr:adenosine deaminase [Brevibacterium sp. R8603A2]
MDQTLFPTPHGVDADDPILRLPKVSLHDHLDGGLRPATIVELARKVGHTLPADDPADLRAWFSASANSGELTRYLETFEHTIAVMQTAPALTRVAREWVLDQVADGVFYAEARWAPEQHLRADLDMDAAVIAVQAGLDEGEAIAAEAGHVIRTGQILTGMRHADNSLAVAELSIRHRDTGVVGFDIAGGEAGNPPAAHLQAFDYLHRECFPVTIHAGEAAGVESILEAVQVCGAQRIGHGVRIVEDMDIIDGDGTLGRLAAWILDHQVPLELCPSSNLQTGAAGSIADHPITGLKDLGFAVTVNPDNRLMSATSVSREMRLLVDEAGWDQGDLEWATVNALGCAFIPLDARERFIDEILIPGFERITL